jgi:hypothetical protein
MLKLKEAKFSMGGLELSEFKILLFPKEGYLLLRKSKIAMYISEWINIETLAMFKDCERVPFSRKCLSKLGDQVHTAKD